MATTNTETAPSPPPHTNGVMEDGLDEEERSKMRPADIDADMREMERRKRVELIMNSRLFREELERIIELQMRDGNNSAGFLQQISDMVGSKYNNHLFRNSNCAVPINDIRGLEGMGFAKGEKILRCKLAALFRLIDLYGWSRNIYNHVTARLSQKEEHFLVNPYGLLYSEVTASSLIKVDMQASVIESGTTNFTVNVAGFQLHAAIYAARPDLKCIIHVHTPSVLAVSSLKDGLLPLCQEAAVIGEISQHEYTGTPNEPEERDKIARNLGPNNKVIFLTNHGALCCGETIEESFFNAYNTVSACETQLKVMPFGKDSLLLLSDETRKSMFETARKVPENVGPSSNLPSAAAIAEKRWRIGGLEFEALMRMLDNAGFRTGYIYRQPLIKGELPRPRNDVEVPPAVSSLGYLLEEEEYYKQGVWRKQFAAKGNDRIRWLNSPNVYQKVEVLETGTTDPKKITKWVGPNNEEWVAESSPSHTSTPVKIENALQFVPKNTNPKEFKKLQQQIKENRRADKITSGPQSHILEGVSWEEAKKLQDANMSGTSDQVILVGAASKGIIQREYQHNATVYKTPYAKNPFDTITDEELENYKKDINRKQRGYSYFEEDESDALSSSLPPTGKNITSETEDDSLANDMKVIRIQTSTAPKESRAEVVLSDDIGYFGLHTTSDILCVKFWELRKLNPTLRVVATIKLTHYPSESPKPAIVCVDESYDVDLDVIVNGYRRKAYNTETLKTMFREVTREMTQKFSTGDVFRRSVLLCPSFDSEVEYTTFTKIPQPALPSRRSESPHDFSSTATTEDEDALSSPDSGLKGASSLSSLTSCIGIEYEESKPPQLEVTQDEMLELTVSFTAASDDTSVDDVTVIHRFPSDLNDVDAEQEIDKETFVSEDSVSIGNFSDVSVSGDDEDESEDRVMQEIETNSYLQLSDLDYDEHSTSIIAESFRNAEAITSFKVIDNKFQTNLSVIYEESTSSITDVSKAMNLDETAWVTFVADKKTPEVETNAEVSELGTEKDYINLRLACDPTVSPAIEVTQADAVETNVTTKVVVGDNVDSQTDLMVSQTVAKDTEPISKVCSFLASVVSGGVETSVATATEVAEKCEAAIDENVIYLQTGSINLPNIARTPFEETKSNDCSTADVPDSDEQLSAVVSLESFPTFDVYPFEIDDSEFKSSHASDDITLIINESSCVEELNEKSQSVALKIEEEELRNEAKVDEKMCVSSKLSDASSDENPRIVDDVCDTTYSDANHSEVSDQSAKTEVDFYSQDSMTNEEVDDLPLNMKNENFQEDSEYNDAQPIVADEAGTDWIETWASEVVAVEESLSNCQVSNESETVEHQKIPEEISSIRCDEQQVGEESEWSLLQAGSSQEEGVNTDNEGPGTPSPPMTSCEECNQCTSIIHPVTETEPNLFLSPDTSFPVPIHENYIEASQSDQSILRHIELLSQEVPEKNIQFLRSCPLSNETNDVCATTETDLNCDFQSVEGLLDATSEKTASKPCFIFDHENDNSFVDGVQTEQTSFGEEYQSANTTSNFPENVETDELYPDDGGSSFEELLADAEKDEENVSFELPAETTFKEPTLKYDCNQNQIPDSYSSCMIDQSSNNCTKSEAHLTNFTLNLSLHIEWTNDESLVTTEAASCEKSNLNEGSSQSVSSNDGDLFSPHTRQHYIHSLFILKDFKHNYPKFIQYSDFSPKVRRRAPSSKHVPRPFVSRTTRMCRKSSSLSRLTSTSRNLFRELSDDGCYRRYTSADWSMTKMKSPVVASPSFVSEMEMARKHDGRSSGHTDEFSFRTSTPKDVDNKDVSTCSILSPIVSSLEEFEILESLLEGENF